MSSVQQPAQHNPSSIHNLGTLLKRLEAATSRLEDIALAQQSKQIIGHIPGPSALPQGAQAHPAAGGSASAEAKQEQEQQQDSPAVAAYRELLDGPLKKYGELSETVGGVVAEQASYVTKAFLAQLDFLVLVSQCTKITGSDPKFGELLKPTSENIMKVTELKDKSRGEKKLFNHLSEVAEGIPGLAWVTLDQKPAPFVADMKESAQFYANRVVKDYKDTDPKQVEWARSFIALLEDLRKFVLAHHTTGLSWNAKGKDVATYLASASSAPSSTQQAAPSAPPPPPGPPAPPAPGAPPAPAAPGSLPSAPKAKAAAGDMSAVFADLNQGGSVTGGLRKVDKSEMTHKNPALRAGGTVASPSTVDAGADGGKLGRPTIPKKPASFVKKPPKTELDGNKWTVENHENNREIVIADTEIGQVINVFSCKNSVIQIKGKVNAISLVGCSKTSVLLDSTVSALSITSSPSFTIQILGLVPTILVDNTDIGQIYLSKESLGVEIITSKTSSLNISLPDEASEDGEFVERAVPEQMKTTVVGGKLKTEIVEHSG